MVSDVVSNSVQLFCSPSLLAGAAQTTTASDGHVFHVNLESPQTEHELAQRFLHAFHAPWDVSDLDAVVSLGSELYWVEGRRSFLTILTGLEETPADLAEDFCSALIRIVDRMRTAGDQYTVMFPAIESSDELLGHFQRANESLTEVPNYPWNRRADAVPVIDHRDESPSS